MAFTSAPTNLKDMRQERVFSWAGLTNGSTGKPYELPVYSDKTVHIHGTFGSGGSVTLYGSNNPADLLLEPAAVGATWVALTDSQGNAITKTALSIEQILENPWYICPKVTAGDGDTLLTVTIAAHRTF